MLRHKNIERICCLVLAVTILITCLYMAAAAKGFVRVNHNIGYENRLFDQSYVHTIDIVMDDWEGFLNTCTSEEYSPCTLVIDGESYKNVGIRGKGNTSLSSVASFGNDRYSFKVEFDQYQTGKSYHGLDKLSLNNLIYDNTYMKDYLAYTLMGKMGVAAPLCSFVEIRVNGETFGTYLAVEGVEDSFLNRNYGADHGELYKPDTGEIGGGRGNGRDFNMDDFMEEFEQEAEAAENTQTEEADGFGGSSSKNGSFGGSSGESNTPAGGGFNLPEGFDPSQIAGGDFTPPEDFDPAQIFGGNEARGEFNLGGFGMGSSETKLQYVDDNPESYSNIFASAKTQVSEKDQTRLIASLKKLSDGDASVVDQNAMLRYLAVHDFLQNGDSYTGTMVHNYYLYEENGVLSMIPWDYNLAYGTFMGGSDVTSTVNAPIDSPVSGSTGDDRPMVGWIFDSEESTKAYHEIYQQFISDYCMSGWLSEEIARVENMLTPYVNSDPTAFCTFEEFETAVDTLQSYCDLRAQSVQGQLSGSIPSTTEGQRSSSALINASGLTLTEMGTFGGSFGGMGGFGNRGGMQRGDQTARQPDAAAPAATDMPVMPEGAQMPEGGAFGGSSGGQSAATNVPDTAPAATEMPAMPQGGEMPAMPQGAQMPEGGAPGGSSGTQQATAAPTEAPPAVPSQAPTGVPAERVSLGGDMKFPADRNITAQEDTHSQQLLLIVSAGLLLLALLVAKLFKRNN